MQNVNPYNELLRFDSVAGTWDTASTIGLEALSLEIARQSQMIGFNNAFIFYAATCFLVIPVAFLWRRTTPNH